MISKVAPDDLIRRDYEHLKEAEELNTTEEIADLIFVQSLEGRAHNGAGSFQKRFYVNTTIDDIVHALRFNPKEVKRKRQNLIDEIVGYVEDAIGGKPRKRLLNSKGRPLLRIPNFLDMEVDPGAVLKGIYVGGLRDDPEPRRATEQKYGIRIGYGKCYPVNVEVMEDMQLDGETLSHREHLDSLEAYKREGLIVAKEELNRMPPGKIRYLYIRHALGPGQSDDGALVAGGLLYNRDFALGIFLADAIDTLEKYVLAYEDQDSDLANYIGGRSPELGASMDELHVIAYLAAIPEGREGEIPDSSLRYFLLKDPQVGQCALESHLNFIEGKPYFPMFISFHRVLSTDFYGYIRNKVLSLKGLKAVMTSEALVKGLEAPVEQFLRRPAITVKKGISLREAFEKMRESGAEFIVIQDEQNQIQGVISMNDLLKLIMEKGA